MVHLDKSRIDAVLSMYNPKARYLLEADIDFPRLEGKLWLPKKQFYLSESTGIEHISNTEANIFSNQALFLLYRDALLKGKGNLPTLTEKQLKSLYDVMFVKKEEITFEKFADERETEKYIITVENKGMRKKGNTYFFWNNISVQDFLKSKIVGGIIL